MSKSEGWFVILLILLLGFSCSGCEEQSKHVPRPEFGTVPPDCGHLYNVGKHKDWADCMGVGFK